MIFIYNKEPLFDTLLCVVKPQRNDDTTVTEKKADLTIISQDGEIVGYNIEQASKKFELDFTGVLLELNPTLETAVESYISQQTDLVQGILAQQFVIGHVDSCEPHPDSNKLSVCLINTGDEVLQIVCGASNIAAEQRVVVAKIGCMMPTGLVIEPGMLRKVASNGMVCSTRELQLPEELAQQGIMVLPVNAPIGALFFEYLNKELL